MKSVLKWELLELALVYSNLIPLRRFKFRWNECFEWNFGWMSVYIFVTKQLNPNVNIRGSYEQRGNNSLKIRVWNSLFFAHFSHRWFLVMFILVRYAKWIALNHLNRRKYLNVFFAKFMAIEHKHSNKNPLFPMIKARLIRIKWGKKCIINWKRHIKSIINLKTALGCSQKSLNYYRSRYNFTMIETVTNE